MIQSVNLPPSAYTITSSAHCNPLQPTAKYPVHIQCTHYSSHYIFSAHCSHVQPLHLQCTLQPCTAMYSYLQPIFSAHCSHVQLSAANIQCTLQPSTTTYTTAIPFSAHCSYTICCQYHTVHLVKKGKPIPLLAYLQSSP